MQAISGKQLLTIPRDRIEIMAVVLSRRKTGNEKSFNWDDIVCRQIWKANILLEAKYNVKDSDLQLIIDDGIECITPA